MVVEKALPLTCDGFKLQCGSAVPDEVKGIAVLLHGIPSISPPDPDDKGYPGLALDFAARGWAAVWADMRAVRESEGFFSIEGWVRDAEAVIAAACSLEVAGEVPLAVVGSSAGGAVSVEAIRRGAPVDALALLAAPASWLSFADDPHLGLKRITEEAGMQVAPEVLEDPVAWALEFEGVTTESSIREVHIPILIMHGTADDVVPADHAQRIADRAPQAELHILEGAAHQLRRDPRALDIMFDWLGRTLP
jgi:pimeloyl-ACP methyl ester carboxylesterase